MAPMIAERSDKESFGARPREEPGEDVGEACGSGRAARAGASLLSKAVIFDGSKVRLVWSAAGGGLASAAFKGLSGALSGGGLGLAGGFGGSGGLLSCRA